MCVVSNITQPWGNLPTYPYPEKPWPKEPPEPWHPKQWPLPPIETIDPKIAKQLLDVISRLEKIDKALGLLDCKVEKLEKQKIVRRLKKQSKRKRTTANQGGVTK